MSNPPKGRAGGVLPIAAAATRKTTPASKPASKSPAPKSRLIIRRLPPGLTEVEFWEALGSDWKVGGESVEWAAFKGGKVSKDPSKPSRPARAYLKVKDQSLLDRLSARVKQTTFQDARNTVRDPCLIGPPSLEFAPFNKVPSGRIRHDGRQSTIDQDQEFIDFLQSLTEPITKPIGNGTEVTDAKPEKVTTTPLVQYIKEKKANKAKDAATAKSTKKASETKDAKSGKQETRSTLVVKSSTSVAEKARVAKATQEAVQAINRSVAAMQSKPESTKGEKKASANESKPAQPSQPPAKRERQRGDASAAARMLQRDLGLTPRQTRSDRTPRTPTSPAQAESAPKVKLPPVAAQAAPTSNDTPKAPATTPSSVPPSGPRTTRTANSASKPAAATPSSATNQRTAKAGPQPSPGAKSAFLKHANPSQGVTEELLRTTFEGFGTVTKCEIDKKKGLGYVDFTDTESLKKAMQASPVKVGNGQVVVLEHSSPYARRGQGQTNTTPAKGPGNNSPKPSAATTATPAAVVATPPPPNSNSSAESAKPTSSTNTSTPTPPTAPRGALRTAGGAGTGRGGRGGHFAPRSEDGSSGPRGGYRGGYRGGRGRGTAQSGRGGGNGAGGTTNGKSPNAAVTACENQSTAASEAK